MFSSNKSGEYNQVSLDEFSDDDTLSDAGGDYRGASSSSNGGSSSRPPHDSLARQQQLMQQQDAGLEMLGQHAERLGQMSLQISEELGNQNKVLTEMDEDLDEANQNLDLVTRKTKEFIQLSGGTKNFVLILALIAIAIVLFFLILYT
jgi:hypothetical protein